MDETFSSIDLVTQCLLDKKRTEKFDKAIKKIIKPDSIVLDVGTGSGILALLAARAGAKKIYSIEIDPYVAQLAQQNIINNGYNNIIDVILGDARNIDLPEEVTHIDVVIMEMLTTGMIDEFQIWAINNLHQKKYINKETIFIPFKQDTYISLSNTDYNDYGLNMRMVKHFWDSMFKPKVKFLSEKYLLNSIPFNKQSKIDFCFEQIIDVKKTGVVNSVYFTSISLLDDHISIGDTSALNGPVSFPLEYDVLVKKGEKVRLIVNYKFGGGFRNMKVSLNKI